VTADGLDELLDRLTTSWPLPGGAVAIVQHGEVVLQRTFGVANRCLDSPVDAAHLFEIGSISKVITAIVVHQLVDEGLLDLETPITEVLPWCEPGVGHGVVRIRHLLQHSAGIIAGADSVPDQSAQAWSLRGTIRSASPGEMFHYSNLGYILLGLAASHVAGRPLPELVRERVLVPLRMERSIAAVTFDDYASLARGYAPLHDDRPWLPGDELVPVPWLEVDGADGNVAASIGDMARFVGMLLGRGEFGGGRVLTTASFERMIGMTGPGGEDVLAVAGAPVSTSSRYGLGINVETAAGRQILSHGGGMVGYASFVLADIDTGLGVAVLTNATGDSPIAEAIAREVAALWCDGSVAREQHPHSWNPQLWRGVAGDAPDELPRSVPQLLLGEFRALAANGVEQVIEIRAEEVDAESSRLILHSAGQAAPLLWGWGGRVATAHPDFRRFPFEFDERASVLTWGALVFRRKAQLPVPLPSGFAAFLGHFRSYSPWFSSFRVVDREGALILIAATGVEAPGEDVTLVELSPGVFRMGADPRLPETLIFGPVVDGRAIFVDRDGCRYSRSFTA
jgi:D-alanyl-D-alanine carboxypeptidase